MTRSYQMISLDPATGLPDPNFGVKGELDLRLDWDQQVDPTRGVAGLHSPPLVVKDTVVVGTAPSTNVKGYLRGFDVRTGKLAWHYQHVPGESFDLDEVFEVLAGHVGRFEAFGIAVAQAFGVAAEASVDGTGVFANGRK